jgi:hypothetical protein
MTMLRTTTTHLTSVHVHGAYVWPEVDDSVT